jgi:Variant SH3 domain/SH3 domain
VQARLVRAYATRHADPIAFAAGEAVVVGARDEEWPEFWWATDPRGRSGWVHRRFIAGTEGTTRAMQDYDARELDAAEGDIIELIEEAGGWWWSVDAHGRRGWLPARDLEIQRDRT